MASQFSQDGSYFAHISTDGKLKIWNTVTNSFEQEFIPDLHLATPCSCLHFIKEESPTNNKASPSPKKKKRKSSLTNQNPLNVVIGTTSGVLLVYSIAKAGVDYSINSETNQSVNCLTALNDIVYSGAEHDILEWSLSKRVLKSKWKGGNEVITSILAIPHNSTLVTASKSIKVWSTSTKEVLRNFTGHSSDITFLSYIEGDSNDSAYLLSGSKGDRLLSCWNVHANERKKNAICNFLMEDVVQNVSVNIVKDGSTSIAATVRSGVIHVYQLKLNGKCDKPLMPKTTVQVVSDDGPNNGDIVMPIKIFGAVYKDVDTLCIGYGTEIILTFENITITTPHKVECLIRKDPRTVYSSKQKQQLKTKTPIVSNDVHYLTPQTSSLNNLASTKRKIDGQIEVPMEKRLENLTLTASQSGKGVPKVDNVAQLLRQGLHSKDKSILRTALFRRDETVIRNTVKRLPVTTFEPLIKELTELLKGKTFSTQVAALWLKHLCQVRAGVLVSNPELPKLFGPVLSILDARIMLQTRLHRLRGKLDLLMPQISSSSTEKVEDDEAVLVFNDKDSSESDGDEMQFDEILESEIEEIENEWDEEASSDENEEQNAGKENKNHVNNDSDSDPVVMVSESE